MYINFTTYKRGEHEQSTDGGETTTVGGETSRWRNVQGAKRPVNGGNVQGAKRQRGETSINRYGHSLGRHRLRCFIHRLIAPMHQTCITLMQV